MKPILLIRPLFRFLSSVTFAVILILSLGCYVAWGTFLESWSDSHRYAIEQAYAHPLFGIILCGFFINILFSTLRRWPFKKQHIPFLVTHIALLMIISGTFIKNRWGIQGVMGIMEGSSKGTFFIPHSLALLVEEQREGGVIQLQIPLGQDAITSLPELHIEKIDFTPHSTELLETWIKGDRAYIAGLRPFPVLEENSFSKQDRLPSSGKGKLYSEVASPWNLFALRTDDMQAAFQRIYTQEVTLRIKDRKSEAIICEQPLGLALQRPFMLLNGEVNAKLLCEICPIQGIQKLELQLLTPHSLVSLPLHEKDYTPRYPPLSSYTVELAAHPTLLLLQDRQGDILLCAFDADGYAHAESFATSQLHSLAIFDNGFSGYGVQALLPFSPYGRAQRHQKRLNALATEIERAINEGSPLSPPLEILHSHCTHHHIDFAPTLLHALDIWERSGHWLYPIDYDLPADLSSLFENFQWEKVPLQTRKACLWISGILKELEKQAAAGVDLSEWLKQRHWPFAQGLIQTDPNDLLAHVTQQLFAYVHQLPDPPELTQKFDKASQKFHLWTAWLRAYSIHLSLLPHPPLDNEKIELECPLTLLHHEEKPLKKLEENRPLVKLQLISKERREVISLGYDRYGAGLKWPIFDGSYLLRFQPLFQTIPYRIRLRDARQINYPHSGQAYSYEADILIIPETDPQHPIETTLSMNRVYETWDGYRFYLANVTPPQEVQAQMAQIIVNYDPAKYWLTYPGGILLAWGIALLFWKKGFIH